MSSAENDVCVAFEEDRLGTHRGIQLEVTDGTNDNFVPPQSPHHQQVAVNAVYYDQLHNICNELLAVTGPPLVRHDITLVNGSFDINAQNKLEEPAIDDEKCLTDQSSKEYQINLSKQKISEPEEMWSHPVPSFPAKNLSKDIESPVTNQKELPDGSNDDLVLPQLAQLQPVADNCIQNDKLHSTCDKLPSATALSLLQHEISHLDGGSDSEPHRVQPEPILDDERTLTDHSLEEYQITDSLEEEMSEPESCLVTSPTGQVVSEVDKSPDVDQKKVSDGSKKKLKFPQFPHHQPVAVNYNRQNQLQNSWHGLPSVRAPSLVHHNVIGDELNDPRLGSLFPATAFAFANFHNNMRRNSALHFPYLELLASPEAEYHPKFDLSNPRLPLFQQTSVAGSALEKPPGWFASTQTRNTYELPTASWASSVPSGVHTIADRILNSATGYNNNDSIRPLTGHKRSRKGQHIMAEGVSSNGFPRISRMSVPDYQCLTTHPNGQWTRPNDGASEGYSSSRRNFKVNGSGEDSLRYPSPHPFSGFSQGLLSLSSPNQNCRNAHPPKHSCSLAPSNVGTRARGVYVSATNSLYNPYYEQLGLPVDPIIRAFMEYRRRNIQDNLG